jgi:hypothetical protein
MGLDLLQRCNGTGLRQRHPGGNALLKAKYKNKGFFLGCLGRVGSVYGAAKRLAD